MSTHSILLKIKVGGDCGTVGGAFWQQYMNNRVGVSPLGSFLIPEVGSDRAVSLITEFRSVFSTIHKKIIYELSRNALNVNQPDMSLVGVHCSRAVSAVCRLTSELRPEVPHGCSLYMTT